MPAHEASAGTSASTSIRTSDAGSKDPHQQQLEQQQQPLPDEQQQNLQQHQQMQSLQQLQQVPSAQQDQQQELQLGDGWGADADDLDLQLGLGAEQQQQHQDMRLQEQRVQEQLVQPDELSSQQLNADAAHQMHQGADHTGHQPLQQHVEVQPDVQQFPQLEDVDSDLLQQQWQQEGDQWAWQEEDLQLSVAGSQQQQQQPVVDTGQLEQNGNNSCAALVADLAQQGLQHAQEAEGSAVPSAGAAAASAWDGSAAGSAIFAVATAATPDANGNHAEMDSADNQQDEEQHSDQRSAEEQEWGCRRQQQEHSHQPEQLVQYIQEGYDSDAGQQQQHADMLPEQQHDPQQAAAVKSQPNGVHWPPKQQQEQHTAKQEQQQHEDDQQLLPFQSNGMDAAAAAGDTHMFGELQQQLAAREGQLSRAAAHLSELETSVAQLTEAKAGMGGCKTASKATRGQRPTTIHDCCYAASFAVHCLDLVHKFTFCPVFTPALSAC